MTSIEFPRYFGAQMHCHSSIEGPASVGAHCYEARRAGVDVVWLTDHDTRISLHTGGPFVSAFDFEGPGLIQRVARTVSGGGVREREIGWRVIQRDAGLEASEAGLSREQYYTGSQSMLLAVEASEDGTSESGTSEGVANEGVAPAEWQHLVVRFDAEGNIARKSLLSDLTVGIAVYVEEAPFANAAAWLDLVLCEQPPDLRQTRLRYLLAGDPAVAAVESDKRTHVSVVPLTPPAGKWHRFEVRPAQDADQDGLGGIDNSLVSMQLGLRVRAGVRLRLFIDDLTLAHRHEGGALHTRQRALAREKAAQYGVVCHVAQEVSQAGPHKNTWGAVVPVMDYAGNPGGFSPAQGVAWVQQHADAHGTVWGLNHPFSSYNRRTDMDEAGVRERELQRVLDRYITERVSGAYTLEVGFPMGRHQFALEHYLRLWDGLSARGIVVAGIGSSDAHSARVGWQNGNNFATYIRAETSDEAALLRGLRARDVYMADPVRFRSRLRFRDRAGHRMGEVVQAPEAQQEAILTLERTEPAWRLCWVVDGERQPPLPLLGAGGDITLPVDASRPTFVRAEVWDTNSTVGGNPRDPSSNASEAALDGSLTVGEASSGVVNVATLGRCIALTNPIWYGTPEGV